MTVVQPDKNVDYCASLEATVLNQDGASHNYTDAIDALPNSLAAFSSSAASRTTSGNDVITASGLFQDPAANNVAAGTAVEASLAGAMTDGAAQGNAHADSGVSDAGAFVLAETALGLHCWGQNPVVTCKLQLNGQDRFSEREGSYFDVVQPFQCHTRNPDSDNVYSFALRPEEHQPSGTCNFSRIDNAPLIGSFCCYWWRQHRKSRGYQLTTMYCVCERMGGLHTVTKFFILVLRFL